MLLAAGCGESGPRTLGPVAKHEHTPPHGGTVVVLGDELYHLELVHEPTAGRLIAYVLDGHLENFVRVAAAGFEVTAKVGTESRPMEFTARANTETGERVGDTAQFESQADWLKGRAEFDAVLKSLTIRGKDFKDVAFNFPRGNDNDRPEH
jgi:hypothetical protein